MLNKITLAFLVFFSVIIGSGYDLSPFRRQATTVTEDKQLQDRTVETNNRESI